MEQSKLNQIIEILRKDVRRALKMKVRGFPRPYYCSFLLRDVKWFNTWASSGSTYRRRSDHTRNAYCDIRVDRYRYDQTTYGGLLDNDEELESMAHVRVPIDDRCHDGLRIGLWRLTEAKFREALADYSTKEAARLSTIDPNRRFSSFTKLPSIYDVKYLRPEKVDEEKWERFCKKASKWLSELARVSGNYVEFDASREVKIFVNTENRIVVQYLQVFSLVASIRHLTEAGLQIEQELVINTATQRELPDMRKFKKLAIEKYSKLLQLIDARKIHSFSGPVLLMPKAAGLLFHEAIGHRVEGSRLLSSGEGQTFKGQVGRRVVNVKLDIYDDPNIRRFQGVRCIGSYHYDDEGTPAERANLVEEGRLKGFLTTRAQIPAKNYKMNGHARNRQFQRPISRMGVTVVEGRDPVSHDRMKELLVEEIVKNKLPFGMIVYDTAGGETDTTSYDFQAFSGEISYATIVYPDGSEEVCRGVDFVGTPLQALSNIIAVGDEQEIDNHYCGAESGFIPVTTISPAVLLKNLELQAKEEELVTQYLLPRPRLY